MFMKMAFLNNRNYIGIDISPEYCEMAQQRLNNHDTRRNQYKNFEFVWITDDR